MRLSLAGLLVVSLLPFEAFAGADMRARLQAIPDNATVEVRLRTKEKIRGLKGAVQAESFVLKVSAAGTNQDREIAFNDLKSIKQLDTKSHTARNIGIAVAVGAVVGVLVLVLSSRKSNTQACPGLFCGFNL